MSRGKPTQRKGTQRRLLTVALIISIIGLRGRI